MAGFRKSAEFEEAVDVLVAVSGIDSLRGGYMVFDSDLKNGRWYEDEDGVVNKSPAHHHARVPVDGEGDEGSRKYAAAELVAGLAWSLETLPVMLAVTAGHENEHIYQRGFDSAMYHLFGGEREADPSPSQPADQRTDSEPLQEVTLAEIVVERARINTLWDRAEALHEAEDGDERDEVVQEARDATIDLQHKVLLAIEEGRVDPVAAAKAATGKETL